jgi:SAM-dependent methyltransferase
VTGIDHDRKHIEDAKTNAANLDVSNVTFRHGDAFSLPFEEAAVDVAFENNMFTHLAENAVKGAREAYRVLKPGGFLAARDVDAQAVVWGNYSAELKQLDKLFIAWHRSRGSDITIGRRLPAILREAGFINTIKSVSADTKGNPEGTLAHAQITLSLLDGPFGRDVVDKGWADQRVVERLKEAIREWGRHPDAFFANVHVEVIGWKAA